MQSRFSQRRQTPEPETNPEMKTELFTPWHANTPSEDALAVGSTIRDNRGELVAVIHVPSIEHGRILAAAPTQRAALSTICDITFNCAVNGRDYDPLMITREQAMAIYEIARNALDGTHAQTVAAILKGEATL